MAKETSKTSKARPRPRAGHKDTFDQIVLMLILAFTFRVFVVEAYVIPTGSMAPTLMGAHTRFTCDNCGYHYDVNYSAPGPAGEVNIGRQANGVYSVHCPNCGYYDSEPNPRVYYGDRILVLKYGYLLQDPRRWDVVVFKTPSSPQLYHYSQAYIKRLVGLPGEQVMILDGDLYVARKPQPTPADWWVQEKPQVVQDALWRIVNDIDYAPAGLPDPRSGNSRTPADYLPWRSAEPAWSYSRDDTGARAYFFRDPSGEGTLRFDPAIGSERRPLLDFIAYDQHVDRPTKNGTTPVGDLKLAFYYTRQGGAGPLELKLSKRNTLFTAVIDPNKVTLFRSSISDPSQRELLSQASFEFGNAPVKVEFINLDYRVRLLIDGKEILSSTPQQYHPDVAELMAESERYQPPLPTVSISAARQVCAIAHLSLWRDTYYTLRDLNNRSVVRGGPTNPVVLKPGEYFCIGDNSPLSLDGRYWEESVNLPAEDIDAQAGVVPERFMLGKAFVVYWPAGFRLYADRAPDLIPNFGEMRFIH